MFWPSFNGAAALPGEPQQRAVLNTYLALCGSVISSFAVSALTNDGKNFVSVRCERALPLDLTQLTNAVVQEHIQDATLAGGVAIGAVADLLVRPYGALVIGTLAGAVATLGFHSLSVGEPQTVGNLFKVFDENERVVILTLFVVSHCCPGSWASPTNAAFTMSTGCPV